MEYLILLFLLDALHPLDDLKTLYALRPLNGSHPLDALHLVDALRLVGALHLVHRYSIEASQSPQGPLNVSIKFSKSDHRSIGPRRPINLIK